MNRSLVLFLSCAFVAAIVPAPARDVVPHAPCNNHVLLTESLVTGPDYTAALFLSKDAVA
jgi:hypothetical protein